jgi:hypothetical protein
MKPNEVIEAYVSDVAGQLPRKQRNDVAFELRALLNEELQEKAQTAGREADAAMAIELARAFGRPGEVAARYRLPLSIIDPADGRKFLRLAGIGLAVIWCAGLLTNLQQAHSFDWDLLTVLGRWWGGTVIPSLWWPGVLVVGFGISAWARRRWPQNSEWAPRAADSIPGGRAFLVLGLFGIAFGAYVLADPRWLLDFFWGGKAAPAAYQALTYTDAFVRLQGPVLLTLILLNIPVTIAMIISGRRSTLVQCVEIGLGLLTCAATAWAVAGGPILMTATSDQTAKAVMLVIVVCVLVGMAARLYRSVRPTPDGQIQVSR